MIVSFSLTRNGSLQVPSDCNFPTSVVIAQPAVGFGQWVSVVLVEWLFGIASFVIMSFAMFMWMVMMMMVVVAEMYRSAQQWVRKVREPNASSDRPRCWFALSGCGGVIYMMIIIVGIHVGMNFTKTFFFYFCWSGNSTCPQRPMTNTWWWVQWINKSWSVVVAAKVRN